MSVKYKFAHHNRRKDVRLTPYRPVTSLYNQVKSSGTLL